MPPGQPAPDRLPAADTLDELADLVGIDAAALRDTVTRFNAAVRAGRDDDFHRGDTTYERAFGDRTAAHSNLGTIGEPPFFALPVHAGAVGNAAAAVIGPGTIAGGITIASALTWGWIAGADAP